jgi:hypothetical protein
VIFFVDDDQRVTLQDIGQRATLRDWALTLGARVTNASLASQFRCSGSDGYPAWLDDALQVRPTANEGLDTADFRVFDSPAELHAAIVERNRAANKARVVAGYCWKWVSKRTPAKFDIETPGHGYRRRWNLDRDGSRPPGPGSAARCVAAARRRAARRSPAAAAAAGPRTPARVPARPVRGPAARRPCRRRPGAGDRSPQAVHRTAARDGSRPRVA